MTFEEILAQILEVLAREKWISYRALKRRFTLDDAHLDDLKEEIIYAKQLAMDEDGRVLVWVGDTAPAALPAAGVATAPATTEAREPLSYSPKHLAEKILTSRATLEGERKQVTVLDSHGGILCYLDLTAHALPLGFDHVA